MGFCNSLYEHKKHHKVLSKGGKKKEKKKKARVYPTMKAIRTCHTVYKICSNTYLTLIYWC